MNFKQTLFIGIINLSLFTYCSKSPKETVENFVLTSNQFDNNKTGEFLSEEYHVVNKKGVRYDKSSYLNKLDTLNKMEVTTNIIAIQDLDSIVKTEERVVTIVDSLLDINPKMVQRKTYRFKDGKILSIVVDTTLNIKEYNSALDEKLEPFIFWAQTTQNADKIKIRQNTKKYLTEYTKISVSEKKQFRVYSQLQGTYVSKDSRFYRKLVFKGKTTVVIIDAFFGMSFPTSYVLDENYIRIRTDKSDLLLEVQDDKTLLGEGFAAGTFTKTIAK
jgi:hypothetical protein